MSDISSPFKDMLLDAIAWTMGIGSMIAGVLGIVVPLFEQGATWLRTGTVPSRDLYWATAPVRCEATRGLARGFDGMSLCRPDYIQFSEWVGLDQILNYIFDIHIGIITAATLCLGWLFLVWASDYVNYWR